MAVDDNCTSKQTFCSTKQTVSQYDDLRFSYNGCATSYEIIDNSTWDELIDAIIKVYNYGIRGTRNPQTPLSLFPDQTINAPADGNEDDPSNRISNSKRNTKHAIEFNPITLQAYNEILSTIGATTISETNPIILGSYFQDTVNVLNNYKLNNTRCNNCNVDCNVYCQGHYTCCDSHCCTECCTECCTNCCTNSCSYCFSCQYSQNPGCSNCQWQQSSGKIYKENIQTFTKSALDIINNTQIVSFNYINDLDKNYKVGFIADNTDEILASKNHNIMDMYNCIGILIKAIQELNEKIDESLK